ncbi:MAG TPA: D-alanine--D-alanine ligase family protein [Natronosporangium sp.]
MSRVRVGVLFGGPSAEHEVSCASAMAVLRALAPDRYQPVAIGITPEGEFRLLPEPELARFRDRPAAARAIDDRLAVTGEPVELRAGRPAPTARVTPVGAPDRLLAELDVVFPALHGRFGEDGVLQGLLETLGVPYVGCGVLASAVGMDKVAMKRAFRAEGLPVAPYVWFDERRWRTHPNPWELVRGLRRPLFVKPSRMGSSIGISRVADGDDLAAAVKLAFQHDRVVLVEQGISARELECGVLGGQPVEASVVGEVTVAGGWFDYRQKYFGDADPMIVPAVLPPDVAAEVRRLAIEAFQAVGGWGLARVDFLYDEAAGEVFVNELNTMPGFTVHSMFPKVWAATGLPYPALLDRLIELAFQRHADERGG